MLRSGLAAIVFLSSTPATAMQPASDELDLESMLPKKVTGATAFLEQYPEYDGTGVAVAIFDTGVDPGAPGLQTTPDGRPKIIDVVDGSGSGDVRTTTIREAEDGMIEGLTGRTLTLGEGDRWANPSGEWRVGMKPAYELFPRGLVGRLKGERTEDFDVSQRILIQALKRELYAWDATNPSPTEEELETRGELTKKLEIAQQMRDDFEDPGLIFDCVVWNDGETWRAAIDTDSDGEFSDEKALTNFRAEREFATFGDDDLMNFVLNIYDEGDTLSVVCDAGAHGTHVAGIVAAYFPDQPELNGVAPGAQIVSVKIGDTRLGSSSVNTGETRGMVAVLENGCDLINMSYGGASAFPNKYRMKELADELIYEHDVIWVASAGNSGPALSTVGGPGGDTTSIIGVGAVITEEMMESQYSVREGWGQLSYPWSSRGPTLDGDLGVDISAPGGAIAPVPNWTLSKSTQMNGTSMSSPNACGGLALVLSALKGEGIDYTPPMIKRALKNTAEPIEGTPVFAQGPGMIRVDRLFEYLSEHRYARDNMIRYEVSANGERGVYLREPFENDEAVEPWVYIKPEFKEDAENRAKVEFETRVSIESDQPWLEVPRSALMQHSGSGFRARVDPSTLEPGAHYAEILGYDADDPSRGPVFHVPVTVIRTIPDDSLENFAYTEEVAFEPGTLWTRFIEAPKGATWADLRIRRLDTDTSRVIVAHMVQLVDGSSFNDHESKRWFRFDDSDELVESVSIEGGRTLEVTLAQNWSSLGTGRFEVEVSFHGITPRDSRVFIDGAMAMTPVTITATLGDEAVSPSGTLNRMVRPIRPDDYTIRPLSTRDLLPDEKQVYELVQQFSFELEEDAKVEPASSLAFVPHAWSEFESQIFTLYDSSNKVVGFGAGSGRSFDLSEGEYALEVHVRHDDPSALEDVAWMPLNLLFHISGIGVRGSLTPEGAMGGGGGSFDLEAGESRLVYLSTPDRAKLPDFAQAGDTLSGTISFGPGTGATGGTGKRPDAFALAMSVIPEQPDKPEPEAKDDDEEEDERTEMEKLAESILDLKKDKLAGLMDEEQAEAFESLAAEILEAEPDSLDVLIARLDRADQDGGKTEDADQLNAIVEAADAIVGAIDTEALAAYLGVNHDEDTLDEDLDELMGEHEDALVDALHRKSLALVLHAVKTGAEEDALAFESALAELERWDGATGDDFAELRLAEARLEGKTATVLGMVNDQIEEDPHDRSLYEQRIELLDEMGWTFWANHERTLLLTRFRPSKLPF